MRLDHVSYAAPHDHLADVVQWIGSSVGAAFSDGGRHPRFGTCNFVLPLAGGTYVEVVAALDHPSADRFPFGQVVRRRAQDGGGWLGWVVAVDDIAPFEQRLGRPSLEAQRHRPDGVELTWRQLGVVDLLRDPQLPFLVEWLTPAPLHPSAGATGDVRIARLEIAGDPQRVASWLGEPADALLEGVEVDWVDDEEPGLVAVHLATPRGTVRID